MSHMYDLTMSSITGDDVALEQYRNQVCLIVNVASR
jgi:glutathione peroxidase-family protein